MQRQSTELRFQRKHGRLSGFNVARESWKCELALEASGLPASSPNPFTILSTPGGKMSAQSSAQPECSRRLLGGFEDDAVFGSQRRSQFPGCHQQREVPRDNLPHHSEGLMEVIGHRVVVDSEMVPSCARIQPRRADLGGESRSPNHTSAYGGLGSPACERN